MGGPGSTITITIEALTEQANAKIGAFFNKLNSTINTGNASVAASATQAAARIGGTSYYFRSAIDGIRLAFAGGGARAAFYTVDEAVRGLVASGGAARTALVGVALEVAEMVPVIGTVALGWTALNDIISRPSPLMQYLTKQNDALKEQADWLQIVQKLRAAGAITGQTAVRDSAFNIGSTQDLMARGLVMGSKEGAKLTQTGQAFADISDVLDQMRVDSLDPTGKKLEEVKAKFLAMKNAAEVAGKVLMASGKMSQSAYDDLLKSIDAAREAEENKTVEDANFKNREESQRKAQEAALKSNEMFAAMVLKENTDLEREINFSAAQQGKTREEIYQQEYDARVKLLQGQLYAGEISERDYTNAVTEAETKRLEGLRKEQEELKRLQAIKDSMAQKDYEAQRRAIQENPFLDHAEKNRQLQASLSDNITDIGSQLANNIATPLPAGTQQQIQLLEQRKQLQSELNRLLEEQNKLQNQVGFINDLKAAWTEFYDSVSDSSKDLARFLVSPFQGLRDGIAQSLQTIIEKGGSLKSFFLGVGQSIERSMIQSFANMAADWITKMAMMAIRWVATQIFMTQVHSEQSAIRTGIHVLSEIAMTAASLAQSLIRRVAAFLEAQPYIFLAAVKAGTAVADIPYVGPILAPIAAATTFAALEALAVFKEGGYTGDGPSDQVAGLVHRGEVVIPAERVQQTGVGRLMNFIRSGRFSATDANLDGASSGGAASGGGTVIQHKTQLSLATFGGEADAKRWADSQEGETWFHDMMKKHAYKYQRT